MRNRRRRYESEDKDLQKKEVKKAKGKKTARIKSEGERKRRKETVTEEEGKRQEKDREEGEGSEERREETEEKRKRQEKLVIKRKEEEEREVIKKEDGIKRRDDEEERRKGGQKEMQDGGMVKMKDGRGRPVTTGEYEKKKELERAKEEKKCLDWEEETRKADRELIENWTEGANTRAMKALRGDPIDPLGPKETGKEEEVERREIPDLPASEILAEVNKSVQAIRQISSFTKGYKGTSRKLLKEVADIISTATKELGKRTENEENRKLKEENRLLKAEITSMKKTAQGFREEIRCLREEFASAGNKEVATTSVDKLAAKPVVSLQRLEIKRGSKVNHNLYNNGDTQQGSVQQILDTKMVDLEATLVKQVGEIINARLATFEERLPPEKSFRPPVGKAAANKVPTGVKPRRHMRQQQRAQKREQTPGRRHAPPPLSPLRLLLPRRNPKPRANC
ncbi:trichohyalin-like [Nylanderia fulva]|uniref:trichohyalin-like n=1 Tax=Nylanderia fulva TaxID=613905 RepID=UPI0010FAFD9F|nr:trichohyalin-like [Nylanderia fulva]